MEEYVHAKRPELHIVLVLNKIDLVPEHVTAAWVRVRVPACLHAGERG